MVLENANTTTSKMQNCVKLRQALFADGMSPEDAWKDEPGSVSTLIQIQFYIKFSVYLHISFVYLNPKTIEKRKDHRHQAKTKKLSALKRVTQSAYFFYERGYEKGCRGPKLC